jgi:hypothetical protein
MKFIKGRNNDRDGLEDCRKIRNKKILPLRDFHALLLYAFDCVAIKVYDSQISKIK